MRTFTLIFMLAAGGLATTRAAVAADSMTTARLELEAESARPGEVVWAGVRLTMARGWHTYWRNPGESGMATSIAWQLPAGIVPGAIHWPPPEPYVSGGLTTFVYHDQTMLLVPLALSSNLPPGPLELKATVSWLECRQECLPGDATVSARLIIADATKRSAAAADLDAWRSRVPTPNPALSARAGWLAPPRTEIGELAIDGTVVDGFSPTDFYPYADERHEVLPAVRVLPADAGRFRIVKSVKRLDQQFPAQIAGLLVQTRGKPGDTRAFEVTLTLADSAGQSSAGPAPGIPATATPVSAPAGLLWKMLVLAFLGGLILNVMPCVLPVIALKILGFVNQSREEPQRVRQLGLLYGLGVVVSFLVLAGVVIAVQAAGEAASWGMQMQNPYFRVALTVVVTLVALNLFGVFEMTLGGAAMGAAAGLASREGKTGAFFNGVLATALATPCTAPFLTVALGFAFAQTAPVIVLMFLASALGLAAPYVVLSWHPGWLRFLPKPGVWMERFKVAMGFPMLATAIWLFDLATSGYGDGGILWIGLFLVCLAAAAWVWGEFVQRGQRRRTLAAAIAVGLVTGGYAVGLESQLNWRHQKASSVGQDIIKDSPDGLEWHRWSPEAVEQARAAGKPVLVDFTAKWCLTCKANKRLAIDIPAVRAKVKEIGAMVFRADYTNKDPLITPEFKRYQRAGVPMVLVFPKARTEPATVLPAALTPGLVLAALDHAAR